MRIQLRPAQPGLESLFARRAGSNVSYSWSMRVSEQRHKILGGKVDGLLKRLIEYPIHTRIPIRRSARPKKEVL